MTSQPLPAAIPVICDRCRDTGILSEGAFSALPDIMNFTPVERRAHVNGWRPEHQRAFIAALAITGSPRQAARAIGKHANGAEQLRNHRSARSFADAWVAAMELARDRESHRIRDNLAELARDYEESSVRPERVEGPRPSPVTGDFPPGYDPEFDDDDRLEYLEAMQRIRMRLINARRLLLMLLASHPEKRAAWEVLVGPVDWDRAERLQAQDDEPVPDPDREHNRQGLPNMRSPDMVLTVEAGLLPDLTGGQDAMAEIRQAIAAAREAHPEDFE